MVLNPSLVIMMEVGTTLSICCNLQEQLSLSLSLLSQQSSLLCWPAARAWVSDQEMNISVSTHLLTATVSTDEYLDDWSWRSWCWFALSHGWLCLCSLI